MVTPCRTTTEERSLALHLVFDVVITFDRKISIHVMQSVVHNKLKHLAVQGLARVSTTASQCQHSKVKVKCVTKTGET